MSRIVQRTQNPAVGDTIILRLVSFNSNELSNVSTIQQVEIFYLDPQEHDCPCNENLIQTIPGDQVVQDRIGEYHIALATSAPQYTVGNYVDKWSVVFNEGDPITNHSNRFHIYPDMWYVSTMPAVYGFDFHFQPNRIRHGSKKWLIIRIDPNVPKATELQQYYTNLAISSHLRIWIEKNCGPCVANPERDLRMIIDGEHVHVRDKCFGFFQIDTRDWDCGIYDVWMSLEFAGSVEVSPKSQLQIY